MAVGVKRKQVDTKQDERLLTGLIVSTEFCRRVLDVVRPEHLKVKYARRVVAWVRGYWQRYGEAPGAEVQTMFNVDKPSIPEAEADLIEQFLSHLSGQYQAEGESHNWAYQADLARDYVRARNLEILAEEVRVYADRGDVARAEEAVRNFGTVAAQSSEWVWPFADVDLQRASLETGEYADFKMDGAVGEVLGGWRKGWFIALFGGYKRGKTWWLGEIAVQAVSKGLRVAFFSLEMSKEDMMLRFMRNATSLPDDPDDVLVPVWDCKKNQDDSCDLDVRRNDKPIPTDEEGRPHYDPDSGYRPCSYCKNRKSYLSNYRIASWFEPWQPHGTFHADVLARMEGFAMQFKAGGRLALRSFPRYGASLEDLRAELRVLEDVGWEPDVIVVDYADILRLDGGDSEWEQLDKLWKALAGLAMEKHAIVVTASQVTEKALHSRSVRDDQAAGSRRKMGHVDLAVGLNQLDTAPAGGMSERESMVMRLGVMGKRHGRTPTDEVYVLQNHDLGQPMLDSWATSAGRKLLEQGVGVIEDEEG